MVLPEGSVVLVAGQTPRGVFLLCEERAKVCTTSEDGKTFFLEIVNPGAALGLDAVVIDKAYEVEEPFVSATSRRRVQSNDSLRQHSVAPLRVLIPLFRVSTNRSSRRTLEDKSCLSASRERTMISMDLPS